jgi:hypothetical protein
LRGLVASIVVCASVTLCEPARWSQVERATGYRLCYAVWLPWTRLHATWWNAPHGPYQWWDCLCVDVGNPCADGICEIEPGWWPDPPPGHLYLAIVTAYNDAGESRTDHGPIRDCY